MAFSDAERTDIRRHCGFPAYGNSASGFTGWRFFQAFGLLEYRVQNLASAEEAIVRGYLVQLAALEADIPAVSERLDTDRAAVWTRNADEMRDRTRLFDDWRRRLCGFLGIPAGPSLGEAGLRMVV